jgi:hypothetical protein
MRKNEAFPAKFLKSADAKTKPIFATISHMEMELVGQGTDQKKKPVLCLEEHKPIVLNATIRATSCSHLMARSLEHLQ